MKKILVFDMDGTIADFYGVENWLSDILNASTRPYEQARPLWNMNELNTALHRLKADGWKVVVTSWLAKGSDEDFSNRTRTAKLNWLAAHNFPYDEIHLVKYGTTKANCTRHLGGTQILVDDNESIRNGWHLGSTINPTTEDLIQKLLDMVA